MLTWLIHRIAVAVAAELKGSLTPAPVPAVVPVPRAVPPKLGCSVRTITYRDGSVTTMHSLCQSHLHLPDFVTDDAVVIKETQH